MPIAEYGCSFLSGGFDSILRDRRAENVVEPGDSFDFFLSHGVGQDNGVVLIAPVERQSLGMKNSNDLTWKIVDSDHLADWIFNAEELLPHRAAKHTNIRRAFDILLCKEGALVYVPALDIEILWRDATIGGMPILIGVNHLNRIIDVRRNALYERHLVLYGDSIRHDQSFRIVSAGSNTVYGASTSLNPNEVVSEIV